MENKTGVVFIVMASVAILIGLTLFANSVAPNIGQLTKTKSAVANVTFTMPAANGYVELTNCGQKVLTGVVSNATGGEALPTTNYTLTQKAGADGYVAAHLYSIDPLGFSGKSINVSCKEYEPKGYVSDAAGRAVVGLIAIMLAVLILTAALPDVRQFAMDWIRG